jgi:hypothetical protein
LARLVRYLDWYTHAATSPLEKRQSERELPLLLSITAVMILGSFFISPVISLFAASSMTALIVALPAKRLANCDQLIALLNMPRTSCYLGEALPQPDATVVTRTYSMALVLNEVSERISGREARWMGRAGDMQLATLLVGFPGLALVQHGLAYWPLLGLPVIFGAGVLWWRRWRSDWRKEIRQQLAASGLAERIASGALDAGVLARTTPAWLQFAWLNRREAHWREGLRGQLLTVAENVRWFIKPTSVPYLRPQTVMLLCMAGGLVAVCLEVMFGLGLIRNWVATLGLTLGLAEVLYGAFFIGPLLAGVLTAGLYASTVGARADIAAEEFVAYVRERLVG